MSREPEIARLLEVDGRVRVVRGIGDRVYFEQWVVSADRVTGGWVPLLELEPRGEYLMHIQLHQTTKVIL